MRELEEALAGMGLGWEDVWVMRADRRAGTLVVVATNGKKYNGALESPPAADGKKFSGVPENQKTAAGRVRPRKQATDGH